VLFMQHVKIILCCLLTFRTAILERTTTQVILITIGLLLCVGIVANLYTWAQMLQALVFSQRRHLQRAIAHLDTLKSEGFLQALRSEVNLMTDMVRIVVYCVYSTLYPSDKMWFFCFKKMALMIILCLTHRCILYIGT
jgi:hypothetical protein